MKHRAVEAAGVVFFAANGDVKQALEKIGLELRDDGEGAEDVENRGVMFDDADCAIPGDFAFAHVAIAIAEASQPLGAFAGGFASDTLFVVTGQLLKNNEQELLGSSGAEEFLRCLEDFERERVACGRKEIVGALGETIEFEGAPAGLWLTPGVEQPGVFHLVAQLLHTHVGHLEPVGELAGVKALAPLEFIENFQAGTAGDGFE
jgi:hypothetical protein